MHHTPIHHEPVHHETVHHDPLHDVHHLADLHEVTDHKPLIHHDSPVHHSVESHHVVPVHHSVAGHLDSPAHHDAPVISTPHHSMTATEAYLTHPHHSPHHRHPISTSIAAVFSTQSFNRGSTRLIDEVVHDDMSL